MYYHAQCITGRRGNTSKEEPEVETTTTQQGCVQGMGERLVGGEAGEGARGFSAHGGLAYRARKLGFCLSLGQWRPTEGF